MSNNSKSATDAKDEKQLKRQARERWDESRAVAAAGDYRKLRDLDRRLVELAPGSEQAESAKAELEHLKVDRFPVLVGLAALLLYALAWVTSLT